MVSTMPLARLETTLKVMVVRIIIGFLNLIVHLQEKDGSVLALGRSEYGRLGLGEGNIEKNLPHSLIF